MSAREELARLIFVADNWKQSETDSLNDWDAWTGGGKDSYTHRTADAILEAGYIKVSEAAIERAAEVLWDREMQAPWSSVADGFKQPFINEARAVVAALREEA